jgi:hypothetical protein
MDYFADGKQLPLFEARWTCRPGLHQFFLSTPQLAKNYLVRSACPLGIGWMCCPTRYGKFRRLSNNLASPAKVLQ